MKHLTDYYLRLALLLGLAAAALWTLVALFGFTSLDASTGADATASALGLVICFLVTFIVVVLALSLYDVWKNTGPEDVLETALWAAPVQRERLGFVLMAGSLLLMVSTASGAIAQPVWPALSGLLLFGGGLILAFTALRDAEPVAPLAVARTRYPTRSTKTEEEKKKEEADQTPQPEEQDAEDTNAEEQTRGARTAGGDGS